MDALFGTPHSPLPDPHLLLMLMPPQPSTQEHPILLQTPLTSPPFLAIIASQMQRISPIHQPQALKQVHGEERARPVSRPAHPLQAGPTLLQTVPTADPHSTPAMLRRQPHWDGGIRGGPRLAQRPAGPKGGGMLRPHRSCISLHRL